MCYDTPSRDLLTNSQQKRAIGWDRGLVQSEQNLQTAVDTREAHEGQREQSGRQHDDGHAAHALGNGDQFELFAHTGKDGEGKAETNGCREGIDDALQQVEVLLNAENGYTKHSTVGGDEGQEDA